MVLFYYRDSGFVQLHLGFRRNLTTEVCIASYRTRIIPSPVVQILLNATSLAGPSSAVSCRVLGSIARFLTTPRRGAEEPVRRALHAATAAVEDMAVDHWCPHVPMAK